MFKLTFGAALLAAAVLASAKKCNGADYIAKSAADKASDIDYNINLDRKSFGWYSTPHVAAIFTESMEPTFDTVGDELPGGQVYGTRAKYIHTVGSLAKVKFVSNGSHPYTGVFKGTDQAYARLSFAKEPSPKSLNTAPGMGLKFLRDGIDSGNMVAMISVDGHDSWNFFKDDFSNHIPRAGAALLPLAKKFSSATMWV
jgi:hypothetical protein